MFRNRTNGSISKRVYSRPPGYEKTLPQEIQPVISSQVTSPSSAVVSSIQSYSPPKEKLASLYSPTSAIPIYKNMDFN